MQNFGKQYLDLSGQNGRDTDIDAPTKSQSPNQPVYARPVAFNNQ